MWSRGKAQTPRGLQTKLSPPEEVHQMVESGCSSGTELPSKPRPRVDRAQRWLAPQTLASASMAQSRSSPQPSSAARECSISLYSGRPSPAAGRTLSQPSWSARPRGRWTWRTARQGWSAGQSNAGWEDASSAPPQIPARSGAAWACPRGPPSPRKACRPGQDHPPLLLLYQPLSHFPASTYHVFPIGAYVCSGIVWALRSLEMSDRYLRLGPPVSATAELYLPWRPTGFPPLGNTLITTPHTNCRSATLNL